MRCPRCGTENDADATLCSGCSFELNTEFIQTLAEETEKSRRARLLRIVNYGGVLAVLATALSFSLASLFLSGVTVVFILPVLIYRDLRAHRLKKRGQVVEPHVGIEVTILCYNCLALVLALLASMDAPPIPNDYTQADLLYPGPQYDVTWELLNSLDGHSHGPNYSALGLTPADANDVKRVHIEGSMQDMDEMLQHAMTHSEVIQRLWEKLTDARHIIASLAEYDQITDLSEPTYGRLESMPPFLHNAKALSEIHVAYVLDAAIRNEVGTAVEALADLHCVFRRLSVNARLILTKLVCYGMLSRSLHALNVVINQPDIGDEVLLLIGERFAPLTDEELSLANCLKGEYLKLSDMLINEILAFAEEKGAAGEYVVRQSIKINSSKRLLRNHLDGLIAGEMGVEAPEPLSVWPSVYPPVVVELDEDGNFPFCYWAWNPVGASLIGGLMPAHHRVVTLKTRVGIQDDLFQIVLAMRLGRPYSLKARAYSDEYVIDVERRMIYSPGPDGEPFTKDDITLPINPDVLGLTAGPQGTSGEPAGQALNPSCKVGTL